MEVSSSALSTARAPHTDNGPLPRAAEGHYPSSECISERLWKCLVGRYGGYFEERYNEAYDDRAYHAKGLNAPAKYAPTLEVRKGNARYLRG